ncbi:unnamed protein product [Macrosiphum euphorbiae]|uniref:Uncharacterized protein n=1 Tax=Macrosiphum euphorbiae TaxID=13131 RepID=A0AAV0Y7I1_9HEMI|nr:unnamed protein product [Macrosiphum euphorbiae]
MSTALRRGGSFLGMRFGTERGESLFGALLGCFPKYNFSPLPFIRVLRNGGAWNSGGRNGEGHRRGALRFLLIFLWPWKRPQRLHPLQKRFTGGLRAVGNDDLWGCADVLCDRNI